MKAHLQIAADQRIEVEPDAASRIVKVCVLDGVDYEWMRGPFTQPNEGSPLKVTRFAFTKAEARALGSAILGCAAEI